MLIARKGKFGLETATFLGEHTYNTHELNIVKFYKNKPDETEYNYVIADFDLQGQIVSCGDRLFDELNSTEDLEDIKPLIQIAESIIAYTEKTTTETRNYEC